jgi:hypothetical protein
MRQHIPWDAFETALWPKKKIQNVRSAPTRHLRISLKEHGGAGVTRTAAS